MIHAVIHHGWNDLGRYEAYRQRLLAARSTPAKKQQPSEMNPKSPAMQLLGYLARYEQVYGQMPSYQEIAAHHLHSDNPGLAHYCVSTLEKAGLVEKEARVARGLRITSTGRALLEERTVA